MKWINSIFAALFAPARRPPFRPAQHRPAPPPREPERIELKLDIDTSDIDAALASVAELRAQWTEVSAMIAASKGAGAVLVGQVAKLELAAGDALVLTVPNILTVDQRTKMIERVRQALGHDARVLILDGGISVAHVSAAATDSAAA